MKDLLTFPVQADDYGIYIFDAEGNMVADDDGSDTAGGHDCLKAAADALNIANGYAARGPARRPTFLSFPLFASEDGLAVLDGKNRVVVRIRGWGRLKYRGEEQAIEAQKKIARAIADAMNNCL